MTDRFGSDDGALFSAQGQRKYLLDSEAKRLLAAAKAAPLETRTFCDLLYYTGCRVTEALELTPQRLDREANFVIFRTLKRRRIVFRAVPIPARLMRDLNAVAQALPVDGRLFPWSRQTAWRRIRALAGKVGITGVHATPRGFRHRYGIAAVEQKVPEGVLQRWMGHSRSASTRIYACAVGEEERNLAARMWEFQ